MNNIKSLLYIFLAISLLIACSPNQDDQTNRKKIQTVDFNKYQIKLTNAQSIEENKRLDSLIFSEISDSSLGNYIPHLKGMDENRKEFVIDTSFERPTLVVLYSPFCGWSSADLANELPKAVEPYANQLDVIVLLFLESRADLNLPSDFYKIQLEQIKYLYPKTYLINGREARKLNMYALPSRYYFNEEGKLSQLEKGKVSIDRIKREISSFLEVTSK